MKKNIEIYEDNGGYLHLCILDETGACVAVYGNWVDNYDARGILIDAYKQMQEDPDAYQLWDGNELDDIDEDLTVEDLYKSLSEAQNGEADLIAWTDETGELQMEDWNKIGYAGRNALGLKEDEEDPKMKKYFLIDSCISKAGEEWSEILDATNEADAIEMAKLAWDKMAPSDRKRRDDFYLVVGVEDPKNEGYPDYDSVKIIWSAT